MSRSRCAIRNARSASIEAVLGVIPVYEQADFVQAQTPGTRDVLVFERKPRAAGKIGGIAHFGFRLQRAGDIDQALAGDSRRGRDDSRARRVRARGAVRLFQRP